MRPTLLSIVSFVAAGLTACAAKSGNAGFEARGSSRFARSLRSVLALPTCRPFVVLMKISSAAHETPRTASSPTSRQAPQKTPAKAGQEAPTSAAASSSSVAEAQETAAQTRAEAAKGDGQATRLLAKQAAAAQKAVAAHTGVGRNVDAHA